MQFQKLPIVDAFKIVPTRFSDARGLFTRLYCHAEFVKHGIIETFVQTNYSYTTHAATLRGLHYQLHPSSEGKLVTCVAGKIWDCLLDLRPQSPTYGTWFGAQLCAEEAALLYVPKGVAHGFITLQDACGVLYQVTHAYDPLRERGVRWNDPAFSITWPKHPLILSARDLAHPDFDPKEQHANFVYGQ